MVGFNDFIGNHSNDTNSVWELDEPIDVLTRDFNFDPEAYEEFSYVYRDNKGMVEKTSQLYCDSKWSHFGLHL